MDKLDILQQCTVEGNVIKLPNFQLDRKLYLEVKKSLELIGGQWKSGKTQGFVFQQDPTELLESIANGDNRNLKQEFQFFPTPANLANYIVSLSQLKSFHDILEPSAGQGAIVKAIHEVFPDIQVDCYELMELNQTFLNKLPNVNLLGGDFLESSEDKLYDRIIANPPFKNNQDIEHIQKMFSLLKPGGRLVSICSRHWQISSNRKPSEFRKWLDLTLRDYQLINVEAGAFEESGTNIPSAILVIDKPEIHKTVVDYLEDIRMLIQKDVDIIENEELLETIREMKLQYPHYNESITKLELAVLDNNMMRFADRMWETHQLFNQQIQGTKDIRWEKMKTHNDFCLKMVLPQQAIDIYNQALKSKDIDKLVELLHPDNKHLRKHFKVVYNVKLPRTIKGTKQVIEELFCGVNK